MKSTVLLPYSPDYYDYVNKILVPTKYLDKYTRNNSISKLIAWLGIYRNHFLLLVSNEQVIGCILIRQRISNYSLKRFWWVYGVYINDNFRGKGFGEAIIQKAIYWLDTKNAQEVFLYVNRNNTKAINLYLKYGFEIVLKSKYHKIRSNQYLMMKMINV